MKVIGINSIGYWEISIAGSDTASDLNEACKREFNFEKVLNILYLELDAEHSQFNTHGCVNVALVLIEKTLAKLIELKQTTFEAEYWDEKQYHLETYHKLIDSLCQLHVT